MVYLAHYGKVTLREKFPGRGRMPTLPGAIPHLSLGYSVASPRFIGEQIAEGRGEAPVTRGEREEVALPSSALTERALVDERELWRGTVYPASPAEAWFVSGSARYWKLLEALPGDAGGGKEPDAEALFEAVHAMGEELAALNASYLYTTSREEDLAAFDAHRAYDRYGPYRIPRIKGTFALHQLRLHLGTERFVALMRALHERFAGRSVDTKTVLAAASELAGEELGPRLMPWLTRTGLPELVLERPTLTKREGGYELELTVRQGSESYPLVTAVLVELDGEDRLERIELTGESTTLRVELPSKPHRVVVDPFHDVPTESADFYVFPNLFDDFDDLRVVYGTSRQIEAGHTIARSFRTLLADTYIEIIPPLHKDSELDESQLRESDLVVLGGLADNALTARLAPDLPLELGRDWFRWRGELHARPDEGIVLVVPNPWNPKRVVYLVIANSALELHRMTKSYHRGLASWALFRAGEVVEGGYHERAGLLFAWPSSNENEAP